MSSVGLTAGAWMTSTSSCSVVCKALWDSVAPGAFIWDRESGVVCDPAKVHAINHAGRFFKVRGPLNVVPSPQGHPVLIQAGASPRGIKASAYFAGTCAC